MKSVQDLMLGGGHQRQYSPQEQAEFSAKFPSLVWRDGVPYTHAPDPGVDPNDPYAYQSGADSGALVAATQNQPGGLVEADLNDPNIWRQLGGLAAGSTLGEIGASFVPGGGPLGQSGFTGGGTGAVGGYSSATAAPSMGAVGSATLPGMTTGATLAAPSMGAAGSAALPGLTSGATLAGAPGVGMGTTAATAIPSGAAASLPSAAAPVAGWEAPAATGWKAWLPKVKEFLPLASDLVRGITANSALNKANKQQQEATDKALKINQGALETAGNVYQQQRQDTQNLANIPYQTLGNLMGITIPDIGPASNVVTSASPTGNPTGLVPASQTRPLGVNEPWQGPAAGAPTPFRPGQDAATLAQINALPANRQATSRSGYDPRRA